MKSKQELREKPQCIYRMPCKCCGEYIDEISRRLDVRINKPKYKASKGIFDRYKFAVRVFEEGHQCKWNQAVILQFEPIPNYRKIEIKWSNSYVMYG